MIPTDRLYLILDPESFAWLDSKKAACRQAIEKGERLDPSRPDSVPKADWWFPTRDQRRWVTHRNAALAICRGCDLRVPCMEHATRYHEWGIWGGTTDQERVQLRARYPRLRRPA